MKAVYFAIVNGIPGLYCDDPLPRRWPKRRVDNFISTGDKK